MEPTVPLPSTHRESNENQTLIMKCFLANSWNVQAHPGANIVYPTSFAL